VSIRFYRPCEELRGVVARIYAHASAPVAPGDRRWLIVPDGDVKLVLPLAGAIRCRIGATSHLHRESRLIVSGMRTLPGELSFPDGVDAIGIVIRPEGAYRLLGSPHHRITNATFDGEEILDARARHLQSELTGIPREEDRVACLQARLCQWLRVRKDRDLAFEAAVARLIQDHYFDQSHFLKAFKQYTGVTPRAYSATPDYGFIYIPD
jgi:hypothetical protein